jgi:hypothetical protein
MDVLSFMEENLATPFVDEALSTHVDRLSSRIEQVKQEEFKCQHELLNEIDAKSAE